MEGIIVNVTEIKVKKLAKNIFYITGAITNHKEIGISNSINEDVYPTIEAMIRSGDVTD